MCEQPVAESSRYRLEDDERCLRLEKLDRRLVVFIYQNYMMFFLLQDYIHDLEKEEEEQKKIQKCHNHKARIKDAMKLGKVTLASTLTFEEFKVAILEDIGFPSISDINFKVTPFT
ncbi:unnamed protein product, partial [Prunus brigantina]